MKGIPTDDPLFNTYWRKRTAPPDAMNPDRDGCGLLVQSGGAQCWPKCQRLTGLATGLVLRHGFEPAISLTTLTDRTLACIISLAYDRDMPGEDDRAMACHHDLLESLASAGYYSYRLSIGSMSAMSQPDSYMDLLQNIKQTH